MQQILRLERPSLTMPAECFGHRMEQQDPLTERIIGCAIEVHRELGAGLLESAYQTALCIELADQRLRFDREKKIPLFYKSPQYPDELTLSV